MKQEEFLENVDNMSNHRHLLWEALELTNGPVIEFGSGFGSTPFLKKYCKIKDRLFTSYDSNQEWANKTGAIVVPDWEKINIKSVDVLFLDHAPGERRQFDLVKYKDIAKIIVIHDSEPIGAGNYQVRQHFNKFKYVKDFQSNGAWATMLSNFIAF
jgi:hypothetical protein